MAGVGIGVLGNWEGGFLFCDLSRLWSDVLLREMALG